MAPKIFLVLAASLKVRGMSSARKLRSERDGLNHELVDELKLCQAHARSCGARLIRARNKTIAHSDYSERDASTSGFSLDDLLKTGAAINNYLMTFELVTRKNWTTNVPIDLTAQKAA